MCLCVYSAKILVDLAMPGPERLSSEAILMGTIPVLSSLWTGSSEIDFPLSSVCTADSPGLCSNKVNPYDSADISRKLQHIADNFEQELRNTLHNSQFFNYILVWVCCVVDYVQ